MQVGLTAGTAIDISGQDVTCDLLGDLTASGDAVNSDYLSCETM
jgi:hypothetical protein